MAKEGFSEIKMSGGYGSMREYEWTVPKEYYEYWTNRIDEVGRKKAEEERFDSTTRWGYGLYGWKLREKDGLYCEWWETGSTCD